jgi:hypothetical protein
MGNEFGARREGKSLYTEEGFLDFDRLVKRHYWCCVCTSIKTGLKTSIVLLLSVRKDPMTA